MGATHVGCMYGVRLVEQINFVGKDRSIGTFRNRSGCVMLRHDLRNMDLQPSWTRMKIHM
jgi:hypothetical protein